MGPEHAEGIHAAVVASLPELLPWVPWARSPSPEGSMVMAQRAPRDWLEEKAFQFAMLEKPDRMALGVAGLNSEAAGGGGAAQLDPLGPGGAPPGHRGLHEPVAWARDVLGHSRLTLWAGRENAPSRRVAEKLGFVHVGPLSWRPDGGLGNFDAASYELDLPR